MSYKKSQVAFIDTETTGLHPDHHEIWDIAIIVDDEEHCWQNKLSQAGLILVDDWVRENTRFSTDYNHETAIWPWETAERLEKLLKGRHLVGACPWFDSERLHSIYRRHMQETNHPWHYHLLDVECLALADYIDRVADARGDFIDLDLPIKSDDLSRMIGVEPPEDRHTAIGDARWAKQIFEKIFGEGE